MSSEGWKVCNIGEIGRIVTGKTPSTKIEKNFGNKYPFVTPRDMLGQKRIYETERYLSDEGLRAVKNCLLPKNAICVSCIGSDMGKVVMTTTNCVTNQQLNSVICDETKFKPEFIYYAITNISEELINLGHQSTAIPILNKTDFSNFQLVVPELPTQRRIAEILSALDDKIELNRQTNATLEAIAQAIFKEWFVDFNYPGATGEMVESELGPIPKGWSVTHLGDEGEFKNGVNYSRDESGDHTYSIVNVRNIVGNRYVLKADLDKIAFDAKKAASYKLSTQDIIIARSASPGEAAILFELSDDTIFSGFTIRYRVNVNEHLLFLFLLIQSIKEKLTDLANGTTLKSINQASLKNVQMVLPDEKTLGDFSTIVSPIFENIFRNQLESRLLCTTRDLLLPHLMNNSLDLG